MAFSVNRRFVFDAIVHGKRYSDDFDGLAVDFNRSNGVKLFQTIYDGKLVPLFELEFFGKGIHHFCPINTSFLAVLMFSLFSMKSRAA
jgi:hypothetical protein